MAYKRALSRVDTRRWTAIINPFVHSATCGDFLHYRCVMRIELDKLGKNGTVFAHVYQPDEIELEEKTIRLIVPPELKGIVKPDGRRVQVKGSISTQAEVECDRCLQSINIPVEADFDVGYIRASEYSADETHELEDDDLNISVVEDEIIDMDDLAREQVLLAMPTRSLCREDCKGLCPVCGINKNMQACTCESKEVDPRWGALKDLRF
jgi:uncharacterized protein